MIELTDLEICKRIAEIEGFRIPEYGHRKDAIWCSCMPNRCYGYYNPLKDDALCQKLIKKHNISMIKDGDEWCAMTVEKVNLDFSLVFDCWVLVPDYNRAALLCIIKSNERETKQ